ncbi:unnamed protein product [Ilex paraguariensis]|uniref:Uncharacterized protein n=1 Tax=Ilex paraguariensis TaxID=185542 RepID=A0ABC8S770_9AQUA
MAASKSAADQAFAITNLEIVIGNQKNNILHESSSQLLSNAIAIAPIAMSQAPSSSHVVHADQAFAITNLEIVIGNQKNNILNESSSQLLSNAIAIAPNAMSQAPSSSHVVHGENSKNEKQNMPTSQGQNNCFSQKEWDGQTHFGS